MGLKHKPSIDLSSFSLEELRALLAKAQQQLEIRRFEEGVRQAVHEYRRRDGSVIRG